MTIHSAVRGVLVTGRAGASNVRAGPLNGSAGSSDSAGKIYSDALNVRDGGSGSGHHPLYLTSYFCHS